MILLFVFEDNVQGKDHLSIDLVDDADCQTQMTAFKIRDFVYCHHNYSSNNFQYSVFKDNVYEKANIH